MSFIPPDPLRTVTDYQYVGACRYTGYVARSIRLTLACGHTMARKASAGVPKRARCYECGRTKTRPAQDLRQERP